MCTSVAIRCGEGRSPMRPRSKTEMREDAVRQYRIPRSSSTTRDATGEADANWNWNTEGTSSLDRNATGTPQARRGQGEGKG